MATINLQPGLFGGIKNPRHARTDGSKHGLDSSTRDIAFIQCRQPVHPPRKRQRCITGQDMVTWMNIGCVILIWGRNGQSTLIPDNTMAVSVKWLGIGQQIDSTKQLHRLRHYRLCDNKLAADGIMPRNSRANTSSSCRAIRIFASSSCVKTPVCNGI